jgi:hypothetical protein
MEVRNTEIGILTDARVEEVFLDCLFKTAPEDPSVAVLVEGIMYDVGFDPVQLSKHKDEIIAMLDELSNDFKQGTSFLNACEDKHGKQWTDLHPRMEQLFQLGMGIKKVRCLIPRALWHSLPGGMPYYQITA